jgi:MraZ protein
MTSPRWIADYGQNLQEQNAPCGKVEESVEYLQPTVFKGTYHHRIDTKGRLPVPAAFRRELDASSVVVVTLLDQCLAVYSAAEWQRLEVQLAALPAFSKPVKGLTRLLASRAADCEIDGQGRILLPPALRRAAALERDAVVVGVLNRFEVWSPDAWEGFVRESERLLDDVSLDIQWPLAPDTPTRPASLPPEAPAGGGDPQAKVNR